VDHEGHSEVGCTNETSRGCRSVDREDTVRGLLNGRFHNRRADWRSSGSDPLGRRKLRQDDGWMPLRAGERRSYYAIGRRGPAVNVLDAVGRDLLQGVARQQLLELVGG
jgi:hypothetical protein